MNSTENGVASRSRSASDVFAEALFAHINEKDLKLMLAQGTDFPRGVTGLVISGANSFETARATRDAYPDALVIAEPENPGKVWATPTSPFFLNDSGVVAETLDGVLADQIHRGSPVAITPTKYIGAGDSASLKAVMTAVSKVDRSDVLAWFPLDHAWMLAPASVQQLIAVFRRLQGHAIAISLGHRTNPLSEPAACEGLATLLSAIPELGILRTDHLGALEALARSGGGCSFGLRPSHRRITPPETKGRSKDPKNPLPHVGIPELHSIIHTSRLKAELYVNVLPPTCLVKGCIPRLLDGYGGSNLELLSAHLHNVRWVAQMYETLAKDVDPPYRLRALGTMYRDAINAYTALSAKVGHPIKPPPELRALQSAAVSSINHSATPPRIAAP